MEDISKYAHRPAHVAVARRDHAALRHLVSSIPRLAKAGEVNTEAESLAAELKADQVFVVIDRCDVPGRETPLHLAVHLRDAVSAEILMCAGADWSLQDEHDWSALQEAVCTREEAIAVIIAHHYQPLVGKISATQLAIFYSGWEALPCRFKRWRIVNTLILCLDS
ncbi:unnamed protein product [Sphenostylis stenocarpa]|uniref:Uncharacterized protein n=1 Tax=Sphenostylis stenocarpa TaxID=92480 RepID=A0AA86S2W5_9FABA|nr:unnamed protein product [Sphenostylis stenocarpa]